MCGDDAKQFVALMQQIEDGYIAAVNEIWAMSYSAGLNEGSRNEFPEIDGTYQHNRTAV